MHKNKQFIFLISIVVALSSFSTLTVAANLPEAKPDKGLVIFYRLSKMKGAAIRFEITDNARGSIGFLSNGTIIQNDLEPGEHTFTVRAPSVDGRDSITLNVEAGKTYYIRGEILWGWPAGRPKFVRMTDSNGQADLATIK
ncbi:MAG: hypothetical protein ACC657_15630 [Thiohalomonadales bacterium]